MSALSIPQKRLSLAVLALALAACRAQRHLLFETDPPGASVRLDDEVVGQTPLDFLFQHYGKRQLTVYREGFRTHSSEINIRPPWFSRFPLDFISEVILPFGWRDVHRFEIVLEAETGRGTESDLAAVLKRAESLRRAGPGGPQEPDAALPADEAPAAPQP
jgi:hypothetical protein